MDTKKGISFSLAGIKYMPKYKQWLMKLNIRNHFVIASRKYNVQLVFDKSPELASIERIKREIKGLENQPQLVTEPGVLSALEMKLKELEQAKKDLDDHVIEFETIEFKTDIQDIHYGIPTVLTITLDPEQVPLINMFREELGRYSMFLDSIDDQKEKSGK